MKMLLVLPDDLMRRVKLHAVHRNQKLKDAITQLLEAGMAATLGPQPKLPAPKPVRLRGRRLTDEAIEAAISAGRE